MSRERMFKKNGKPACTVCAHPKKDEIDARLLSGESPEFIAKEIEGVKQGAVRRHKQKHLTKLLPKRLDHVEVARSGSGLCLEFGDIVSQVRDLYAKAREAMEVAEGSGDHTSAIRANAQALRCLEVYFKSAQTTYELTKDHNTKNDMMLLSNIVLGALAEFPEARIEVIKALQKAELA